MFFARIHVADHDAGKRVFALHADKPGLEHHHADDKTTRLVRHKVGPVFRARIGDWRSHNLEILGIAAIGFDNEAIVPVFEIIFDAGGPARNQFGCVSRPSGVNGPDFGRIVIVDINGDEGFGTGFSNAGEHAGVGFFKHEAIGRLQLA